jgi:hypothetical protein
LEATWTTDVDVVVFAAWTAAPIEIIFKINLEYLSKL